MRSRPRVDCEIERSSPLDSKTIRVSGSVYDQLAIFSREEHASIGETMAQPVREKMKQDFLLK